MTAAESLLRLSLQANRGGGHVNDDDRATILDLLERLHGAGEIDFKETVENGIRPYLKNAAFPVAVLGIGTLGVDFFKRMQDLDPQCLVCPSRGRPAFADAVQSHVNQNDSSSYSADRYLNESIDDLLAYWATSIPLDHITWLDKPGDDQGAGILGHIRSVGAFPRLHRALSDLGFDINAKRSGEMPTAASITTHDQLQAFMENGGDLAQVVPVQWPHRPDGVALWEYIFQSHDHPSGSEDLLREIGRWCDRQDPKIAAEFQERMYWWQMRKKANASKDDLLEFLRAHPNWAERRDSMGRNALHVAGRLCPPFLNHVMKTKTLSHLLDEKDIMGHGAAPHVLPTLASYNRTVDAGRMISSLLARRGRLRDFDGHNECGLVISYALDHIEHGMTTIPSPTPVYSRATSRSIISLSRLWVATPEQYERVAKAMASHRFEGKPSPGMGAVFECAHRLFSDVCDAIATPVRTYGSRSEDEERKAGALLVFNAMPARLQQTIALGSLRIVDPSSKKANNHYSGNKQMLGLQVENIKVSAWIKSIMEKVEIDVPDAYMKKQRGYLDRWKGADATKRPAALEELLGAIGSVLQAKSLRDGIRAGADNKQSPDCAQSRPSPRL